MESENDWIGKKVFLKTFTGTIFQGKVIDEDLTKIILIDKFNCRVQLSKIDIKYLKEEL